MRLPTTSSELERILLCGWSVCAITAGWRGSVTSTAVTFLGGDSWAIQSTRRRSRVSWMAMSSPQLPKPLRGCRASSRMFREVGPFAVVAMGPDIDKSRGARLESRTPSEGDVDDQDEGRDQGRRWTLHLRSRQAQHDRRRPRLLYGPRAGDRGRTYSDRPHARAARNRRAAAQPSERAVGLRRPGDARERS